MNEQQLYKFCMENIYNLLHGKLDIDKIIKLRQINFSFDYYIDEVIKEYNHIIRRIIIMNNFGSMLRLYLMALFHIIFSTIILTAIF